jgi:hypothetical protein
LSTLEDNPVNNADLKICGVKLARGFFFKKVPSTDSTGAASTSWPSERSQPLAIEAPEKYPQAMSETQFPRDGP